MHCSSLGFSLLLLALGQQQPPSAMAQRPFVPPTNPAPPPRPAPPAHHIPNLPPQAASQAASHQQQRPASIYYTVPFALSIGNDIDARNRACRANRTNGRIAMPKTLTATTALLAYLASAFPNGQVPTSWIGMTFNGTDFIWADGTVLTSTDFNRFPGGNLTAAIADAITNNHTCVALFTNDAGAIVWLTSNCDDDWSAVLCEDASYYGANQRNGDHDLGAFNKACSANRTGGSIAMPKDEAATIAAAAYIISAYYPIPSLFIGLSCNSVQCTWFDASPLGLSFQPWAAGSSLSGALTAAYNSADNLTCIAITKDNNGDWVWVYAACDLLWDILCLLLLS